ncbi:MAG: rod-binding protein [Limnobacter sp.]|nr:rod-binding protein [Limnobacter sp.]
MSIERTASTAYWDSSGLTQMKKLSQGNETEQRRAAKEAATQFEGILMNELLKAAREGEFAKDADLFNSSAMKNFQGMFDQQVAFSMAGKGMGFAEHIEKMILQNQGIEPAGMPVTPPKPEKQ